MIRLSKAVRPRRGHLLAIGLLIALAATLPAAGAPKERMVVAGQKLGHLSQVMTTRYWAANPDLAPAGIAERLEEAAAAPAAAARGRGAKAAGDVFNADDTGLPQNEESVTVCGTNNDIVLSGTNDYRGLLDPQGNFTGWHFSLDGGRSLANEGLLPAVPLISDPGVEIPSGGDPAEASDEGCSLFAASLAYDPFDPFSNPNGIAVYRSDANTLNSCPGGADPSCWPVRRLVAEGTPPHFLDKEWFDVGESGDAGEVVWVTYSDFLQTGPGGLDFTASIKAVRCDADLLACTDPIDISTIDPDVQFSDVTIGQDGRTYITWARIDGELEETAQTFTIKMRIAEPGSIVFGPEKTVYVEDLAIPFGGVLHANDFRIATAPKNEVVMIGNTPRVFVVWDACAERPLDTICVEPLIKLSYSDDDGDSWTGPLTVSRRGDNYFPTIASNQDPNRPRLALAWFSNANDRIFHNQQDIQFLSLNPQNPRVGRPDTLTRPSNEPEADPLLGGFFIGDYIEVDAVGRRAYVTFNANYRQVPFLGAGTPLPQQDNYLIRTNLGD
jgi:hypothetical protein